MVLRLMNNKEVKLPVLVFSTEQVQLLKFNSQVILVSSSSLCSGSKTLRVPITRYCLRSSVLQSKNGRILSEKLRNTIV